MNKHLKTSIKICLSSWLLALMLFTLPAHAITPLPTPPPGSGSYGLEATKPQAPPTRGARIAIPSNGATFTTSPIRVSGICPSGLLVQVYNNKVMVGSVSCVNGSFSLEVSLFGGTNDLSAIVFDDLDQAGPTSNIVSVTYDNSSFEAFGEQITLTSSYGRRGANPGYTLTWPLQLSGGTGPYAFSIDWGDGKPADLKSQGVSGLVNISHIYDKAGVYKVTIKVTDSNGVTAFLQVVAIANGNVAATSDTGKPADATQTTKVLWFPVIIMFLLLIPAYWLGRQSQITATKNHQR